jgi:hypothetical protein
MGTSATGFWDYRCRVTLLEHEEFLRSVAAARERADAAKQRLQEGRDKEHVA